MECCNRPGDMDRHGNSPGDPGADHPGASLSRVNRANRVVAVEFRNGNLSRIALSGALRMVMGNP